MNLSDSLAIGNIARFKSASGHVRSDRVKMTIWPSGDFTAGFVSSQQKTEIGLGLSVARNSNRPLEQSSGSKKRRPAQLSARGKRVVRSSAAIMDRLYPKWRLSFTTLTIPNLGEAGLKRLLERWSELTHRYYQELKREMIRQGLAPVFFGVVEIQPKRLIRTGLPYPHLHLVHLSKGSKRNGPWLITSSWHRGTWCRLVSELSGVAVSGSPVENCQAPKKSLRNYLSKYLAKGTDYSEVVHLLNNSFIWSCRKLASWYSVTGLLRSLLARSITEFTIPATVPFCEIMKSLQSAEVVRYHSVKIELGCGPPQTIGWVGWLTSDEMKHEIESYLEWIAGCSPAPS